MKYGRLNVEIVNRIGYTTKKALTKICLFCRKDFWQFKLQNILNLFFLIWQTINSSSSVIHAFGRKVKWQGVFQASKDDLNDLHEKMHQAVIHWLAETANVLQWADFNWKLKWNTNRLGVCWNSLQPSSCLPFHLFVTNLSFSQSQFLSLVKLCKSMNRSGFYVFNTPTLRWWWRLFCASINRYNLDTCITHRCHQHWFMCANDSLRTSEQQLALILLILF